MVKELHKGVSNAEKDILKADDMTMNLTKNVERTLIEARKKEVKKYK